MSLVNQADFRKISSLWDLNLRDELVRSGVSYAKHFHIDDLPRGAADLLASNTDVYVVGEGLYSRLPVGGGHHHGMVDYPLACCEFDIDAARRPKADILLAPFPCEGPENTWKNFSSYDRQMRRLWFRIYYGALTTMAIHHEGGHLFPKYLRWMRGMVEPYQGLSTDPTDARAGLFEEAAVMFYTDATYFRPFKPYKLNEHAERIWKKAIEKTGEETAKQMFLDGNYDLLFSDGGLIELADQWKTEITKTKNTSPIAA